VATVNSTVP